MRFREAMTVISDSRAASSSQRDVFCALCRYNLFNALTTPMFYVTAVLFAVLVPLNFFVRHQFFTAGTTDLTLFFSDVPYICILIVPALCYRQNFFVYEDFVPLRNVLRILARFVSVFAQSCVMIILLFPSVLMVSLFGSTDAGQIFTSTVILLCYFAAIISLCLFVGEAVGNKVLMFVLSAVVLALINSAHLFAVYAPLGSFLTSVFKQLSFAWHFDASSKGVLDTRDFFWLIGSCVLLIILADFVSQRKKGRAYQKKDSFRLLSRIIILILLMMNSARWYARLDFSQGKTFSLTPYTKNLLEKIDSPVRITYFRSQTLSRLYPQVRDVSDFLWAYAGASRRISLAIRNPDGDAELLAVLQGYGIQSQPLRTVSGTSTEYTSVYSAVVIEHNGNVEIIPFVMDASSLEYDLDGRLNHLLTGSRREVQIVVGNGMSLYEDYGYVVPWLNSQGFDCNVLDVTGADFADALLSSAGPLFVIGDSEIPVEAAIAMEDYILQGKGNALLAVSPYSAAIDDNWRITMNTRTNIVEMAENWGVVFEPKIAADISCARITMTSDDSAQTQVMNYPMWLSVVPQTNAVLGADLFWATPLSVSPDSAETYLVTTSAAYSYDIDTHSPESLVENNPFVIASDISDFSRTRGTLAVGARISGHIEGLYNIGSSDNAEVIVIADQYFVSTLMQQYLGQDNNLRNFHLMTGILLELNGEDALAALHSKIQRNTSLYKISDVFQLLRLRRILYSVIFALIPSLIILAAVISCTGFLRRHRAIAARRTLDEKK